MLTLGVIGVFLGACAFAQGATVAIMPLGTTWSTGMTVWLGGSADLASAIIGWLPVLLWIASAFALFVLGWGVVFAGLLLLLPSRAS